MLITDDQHKMLSLLCERPTMDIQLSPKDRSSVYALADLRLAWKKGDVWMASDKGEAHASCPGCPLLHERDGRLIGAAAKGQGTSRCHYLDCLCPSHGEAAGPGKL